MRVFLSGATGFLGRALTLALRREGHAVVAWVRSDAAGRSLLGDQAELMPMAEGAAGDVALDAALARCDAVVNLAGEPIISRWTTKRREQLRASRVGVTERLVAALERIDAEKLPRTFVSGSAVGFYGDRGEELLDEASARGAGFLADLCADWEAAAQRAEPLGVRVVLIRTGVVLGLDGGALAAMLPPFRLGFGGRLGSGRQWMPWIHVEDWVRLVCAALTDERFRGPVDATAPEPVTNRDFTRALAKTLRKPALAPVPGFALKLLFGGAAAILLEGQRVVPARARALGFEFVFPTVEAALHALLVAGRPTIRRAGNGAELGAAPSASEYLARRTPAYQLEATTRLEAPLAETFRFFSAPENLGLLTPRAMHFVIEGRSGAPTAGSTIDYRVRVGPLPLRWRTRFEAWQVDRRFVDVQERGPYRGWWHEHRFEARGDATQMDDRVLYAPPFGFLGRAVHRLVIADQLGDIFAQRALAIRLRFGTRRRNAGRAVA